jgi:O-antigen/teichoic acid export membrane protein
MLIPAVALQTVVAQQTAAAFDATQQAQLATTVRRLLLGAFVIWLFLALGAWVWREPLLHRLQIGNPGALWLTVAIGLAMLWSPILQGVLQGQQDFLWLGWLQLVNGAARFLGVLLIVAWLGGHAAGAMGAAFIGFVAIVALAGWFTRRVWLAPGHAVAWGGWLRRVVPLMLGTAASQFMLSADMLLVQSTFDREVTASYGAPGMIGRALMFFTGALVSVMFPKVVRSAARAERTDAGALALGATAVAGAVAALLCTLAPELPLRILKREYWASAPLIPWFVWCMLPLTLATVLISSLLARERFTAVPWLVLVAAAYGAALFLRVPEFRQAPQPEAFRMIVRTLGGFSLLLLAVAAWFTWGARNSAVRTCPPPPNC